MAGLISMTTEPLKMLRNCIRALLLPRVSRAFTKRTTAAEESCTTGVMNEGRMARGVGTVWERERTVQV